MSRPLFKQQGKRPILVCSLTDDNPGELQATIRNAIFDGADGFLLHTEKLQEKYRNRESLKRIFDMTQGRPVMSLNYRYDRNLTSEELMDFQFEAVLAGAACVDMPADIYGKKFGLADPDCGYTDLRSAVAKQKAFAAAVHAEGAQVLSSYHQFGPYFDSEIVLKRTKSMAARGADFIKVAQNIEREDQLPDAVKTTIRMNRELPVPSFHILFGKYGRALRPLSPIFGSCMVLCVQRYTVAGHKDKPLLRATRDLFNNLDFEIDPREEK